MIVKIILIFLFYLCHPIVLGDCPVNSLIKTNLDALDDILSPKLFEDGFNIDTVKNGDKVKVFINGKTVEATAIVKEAQVYSVPIKGRDGSTVSTWTYQSPRRVMLDLKENNSIENMRLMTEGLARRQGKKLNLVPLTNDRGEKVAGGLREIWIDKATNTVYKFNMKHTPEQILNSFIREDIVTRYTNEVVFPEITQATGIQMTTLPHNYDLSAAGAVSQPFKPEGGFTLHNVRKKFQEEKKPNALNKLNLDITTIKNILNKHNSSVSIIISKHFGFDHIFKNIPEKEEFGKIFVNDIVFYEKENFIYKHLAATNTSSILDKKNLSEFGRFPTLNEYNNSTLKKQFPWLYIKSESDFTNFKNLLKNYDKYIKSSGTSLTFLNVYRENRKNLLQLKIYENKLSYYQNLLKQELIYLNSLKKSKAKAQELSKINELSEKIATSEYEILNLNTEISETIGKKQKLQDLIGQYEALKKDKYKDSLPMAEEAAGPLLDFMQANTSGIQWHDHLMFSMASEHNILANIDTGQIRLNTPLGRRGDLNNCEVFLNGADAIDNIKCFDVH